MQPRQALASREAGALRIKAQRNGDGDGRF